MTFYEQSYTGLHLGCLTPQQHERTCDYWYVIQNYGLPHTAFRDADDLYEWLAYRGLRLAQRIPAERGIRGHSRILGGYRTALHSDVSVFTRIQPMLCMPVMDNSEYTLGKVTENDASERTVHYLNINYLDGVFSWPRRLPHAEGLKAVREFIASEGLPTLAPGSFETAVTRGLVKPPPKQAWDAQYARLQAAYTQGCTANDQITRLSLEMLVLELRHEPDDPGAIRFVGVDWDTDGLITVSMVDTDGRTVEDDDTSIRCGTWTSNIDDLDQVRAMGVVVAKWRDGPEMIDLATVPEALSS